MFVFISAFVLGRHEALDLCESLEARLISFLPNYLYNSISFARRWIAIPNVKLVEVTIVGEVGSFQLVALFLIPNQLPPQGPNTEIKVPVGIGPGPLHLIQIDISYIIQVLDY